jgi:polyferredoxin
VRPRTVLYALLLAVAAGAMLVAFVLRTDTELTVQRDRSPNFVRLSNGDIRNAYTVKILNKRRQEQQFELALDGLPGASVTFVGDDGRLTVHPDAVGTFRVLVTLPAGAAPIGSQPVAFSVRDANGRDRASHEAVFVGPDRPQAR